MSSSPRINNSSLDKWYSTPSDESPIKKTKVKVSGHQYEAQTQSTTVKFFSLVGSWTLKRCPMSVQNLFDTKERRAAITIQKNFRGHLARKTLLSTTLFSQYSVQCEKAKGSERKTMPRADNGRITVFLPPEMANVVLKEAGREEAIKRFGQMQEVRTILDSQRSSHLIVPKARLYKDFLVEERLPINIRYFYNMDLYLAQPQLFDDAVREFTRLFSRIFIADILNRQSTPIANIKGAGHFIRYENMPLYVLEKDGVKKGCIGLIDLERLIRHGEPLPYYYEYLGYDSIETIARIFPFQIDIIKEEAHKLRLPINETKLEVASERGKKFFKIGYSDFKEWLVKKNIPSRPFDMLDLHPQRVKELSMVVQEQLLTLNQGISAILPWEADGYFRFLPLEGFLKGNDLSNSARELADKIVPILIMNMKTQVVHGQKETKASVIPENVILHELVQLRSPILRRRDLFQGIDKLVVEFGKITQCGQEEWIAENILQCFMQELVKGEEIFFFDPAFYHDHICWLRY